MSHDLNAVFYSHVYHPVQAGSIDGTDAAPHDNGVYRAMLASSTGLYDPLGDAKAQGDPYCIIFVGRLSRDTTEQTLSEVMSKYGRIKNLRLVRHIVTGASQGYAFVEYETEKEMRYAYESAQHVNIDGSQVLVDYNRQLLMPGWIPRRLGGGLGGRKESGQLRFGGRDRPFRKPLRPIPERELEKLGIPLPGNYLQRWEIPPLPKRRSHRSGDKSVVLEYAKRTSELNSKESQFQDESGRKQPKLRADDDSKGYYEEDYKRRRHSVRRASYQERESGDRSPYQEADHHKRYGGRSHSQEKHAGHEKKSHVSSEDHKRHQTEKHEKKLFYGELERHEKEDDVSRRYHVEKHEEKESFEEHERRGKRESFGDHNREDDVGRHHNRKHERKNIREEERGTSHDHRRQSEEEHHHHRSRKDDDHYHKRKDVDHYHKRKDEHSKERKSSRRSPYRDGNCHDDNTRRQKRRRGDRTSPDNNISLETDSMRMEKHERLNLREMNRWDPSEG